jgi:golgin subfamily B member 1
MARNPEFEALEQRYQSGGDWEKLADLYQESVLTSKDHKLVVARLCKAAVLYRDKLKERKRADVCFEQVIAVHLKAIEITSDPIQKSDLWCDLGKIYMEVIKDREKAVEAYVNGFELDPSKTHIMVVLGDIYSQKEDWPEVVKQFGKDASATNDPKLRARYLSEIADLYSFILSDPERAMEMYKEIISLDHSNQKAIDALESLLVKSRRWKELVQFYTDLKGRTKDSDEIVSICTRLGLIFKDKLHEPLEAAGVYEEILALQPKNFRIASKLEEIKKDKALWKGALSDLDEQIRSVKSEDQKIPLLLKQARIAEYFLDEKTMAARKISEALNQAPSNTEALEGATRIWAARGQWQEVANAAERAARSAGTAAEKAAAWRKFAEVSIDKLNDPQRGIIALESLLRIEPTEQNAREKLIRLYQDHKMWNPLEKMIVAALPAATKSNHKQLLVQLAAIREQHLNNAAGAIEAHEQILELDENSPQSLEALERLYPSQRRWNELLKIYDKRAELTTSHEAQGKLYLAQAKILEEKIGNLPEAAKAYERALLLLPEPGAILSRVEQIYFGQKMWSNLAALYRRSLARLRSPEDQTNLLFKLAELYEQKLGQADNAKTCLESILERAPRDLSALRKLEHLFEQKQQWAQLVEIYGKEMEATTDRQEKVSIGTKVGEIFLHKLRDTKQAEEAYRQVLSIDPENQTALDFLSDYYRKGQRSSDLLSILQSRLATVTEQQPKLKLIYEIGNLSENQLKDDAAAATQYEKVLSLDPSFSDARNALARLYQKGGNWDALARTYIGELEFTRDRIRAAKIAGDIAEIYERHLLNAQKAVEFFEKSAELNPSDVQVLRRLIALLENHKRFDGIRIHYERLLELSTEDKERAEICLRLGEIERDAGADPQAESRWYEQTFKFDPSSNEALRRLKALYEKIGNWNGLLGIYERLLAGTDKPTVARIHYRIGEIYEQHLRKPEQAVVAYQLASELAPDFVEPLRAMRRLLKQEENWGEYLKVSQQEALLTASPQEKAQLLFESASLWRDNFLQVDRAISALEEGLTHQPNHVPALEQLSSLYFEKKDYDRALTYTRRTLDIVREPSQRLPLLHRLGDLELQYRKSPENAQKAYREILSIDPHHRGAIERLVDVASSAKDWKGKLSALQMRLELEEAPTKKVELLFQMAELWKGPLQSVANATQTLHALLQIDPSNADALELLGEVTPSPEQWKSVSNEILKLLSQKKDLDPYMNSALTIASVFASRFDKPKEAIRVLQEAIGLVSDQPKLLDAMVRLYEQTDESLALADMLLRRAKLYKSEKERARALITVARLWSTQLSNPPQAIAALEEALALDPELQEVTDLLVELHLHEEHWSEVNEILSKAIGRQALQSKRLQSLAFQQASVLADHLDQKDKAIKIFEKLIGSAPDHRPALTKLIELYEAKGDFSLAADRLSKLVTQLHGNEAAAIRFKLARVFENELNDIPKAIDQYEEILAIDSRQKDALERLTALYHLRRDFASVARVLLAQIPLSQERSEPKAAALLYRRLGEIYRDELKDPAKSVDAFERALESDPSLGDVAASLAKQFRAENRFVELSEVLEKRARFLGPADATDLYLELAEIWNTKLNNAGQALAFLNEIQKSRPRHRESLLKMAQIYLGTENFRALASTYKLLSESSDKPPEQISALSKLGALQMEQLASPYEAVDTYRKILAIQPAHKESLEQLKKLFGREERWSDLAQILRALIKQVQPHDSAPMLKELAMIEHDRLHQPQVAMKTFEALYRITPADEEAFRKLSLLYEEQGKFRELADLLENDPAENTDPEAKALRMKRLGMIYDDRLHDTAKAAACFEKVLDLAAKDLETLTRLDALYRKLKRPDDATRIVERRASLLPFGSERSALLESLASQYMAHNKQDETIRCYRLMGEDPHEAPRALERIASLYETNGDHEKLSATLSELIPIVDETKKRMRTIQWAKVKHQHLHQTSDAEKVLLQSLKDSPGHAETATALKEIYLETKKHDKAVKLLEGQIQAEKEPRRKAALIAELADIYRGPLANEGKSIELYEQLIRITPHEMTAVSVLADLYFGKSLWKEAAPLFDRLAKIAASKKDPAGTAKIFFRLGTVTKQLGKSEEAIIHFNQALSYQHEHVESLRALADLYFELGQWNNALLMLKRLIELGKASDRVFLEQNYYRLLQSLSHLGQLDEALAVYETAKPHVQSHLATLIHVADLYFQTGSFEPARKTFERILELSTSADPKINSTYALAKIAYEKDKDLPAARKYLTALFTLDSHHQAGLHIYESICEEEKDWPDAIRTLEQLAELVTEPAALSQIYFKLGRIHDGETGDLRKARQCYLKSIELGGGESPATFALEQFCKTDADWEELVGIYQKQAAAQKKKGNTVEATSLMVAMGNLFVQRLKDSKRGIAVLREALASDPNSDIAHLSLARLLSANPTTFAEAAQSFLRAVRKQPLKVEILREFLAAAQNAGDQEFAPILSSIVSALEDSKASKTMSAKSSLKGAFDAETARELLSSELFSPAGRTLRELGEKLVPIYSSVSRSAAILSATDSVPQQTLDDFSDLSKFLGIEFKKSMVIFSTAVGEIRCELTSPPEFAVGPGLYKLSPTGQRFAVAQMLATLFTGFRLLKALPTSDAEDLLDALFALGLERKTSRERGETILQSLKGQLSKKETTTLSALLKGSEKNSVPLDTLLKGLETATFQIAALLVPDPFAGIEFCRRTSPHLTGSLIQFYLSDGNLKFRRK